MLHIWWTCPRIRQFWHKIFSWISKVATTPVQVSPLVALLNFPVKEASRITQRCIFFIILGAKLTLANAWKKTSVSTLLAKRKISWIMNQKKMASVILDRSAKFEQIWGPWATIVGVTLWFFPLSVTLWLSPPPVDSYPATLTFVSFLPYSLSIFLFFFSFISLSHFLRLVLGFGHYSNGHDLNQGRESPWFWSQF